MRNLICPPKFYAMGTKTGIWIDTKKAVIVHISGNSQKITSLESNIESRERVEGESKQFGRFRDQYLNPEKGKQNRRLHQAREFFKDLIPHINRSENVVIFGPAQMKFELEKIIKNDNKLSSKLVGVESADSMTDNQVAAWVRGYFM